MICLHFKGLGFFQIGEVALRIEPRGKHLGPQLPPKLCFTSFFFKPCEQSLPKSVIKETLFFLLWLVNLPFLTEQDGRTLQSPFTMTQVGTQTTVLPQRLKTKNFTTEYTHS